MRSGVRGRRSRAPPGVSRPAGGVRLPPSRRRRAHERARPEGIVREHRPGEPRALRCARAAEPGSRAGVSRPAGGARLPPSRRRRAHERARPEGIVREHRPGEPRALRCARAAEPGSARREPAGRRREEATMAHPAGVPERPKGAGCKPAGSAYEGSNPSPCIARPLGPARSRRGRVGPGSRTATRDPAPVFGRQSPQPSGAAQAGFGRSGSRR